MSNAILAKAEKIARAEIGYREGPKDNETKFGAWFGTNFVAWCAIFQSWVSFFSGTTYLGTPWRFASTISACAHAKKNKRWITVPTIGTIAMMAHTSTTGHVGFVIALIQHGSRLGVVTIEGNTNDQGAREGNGVWLRERDSSSWDGYIILDQTYLNDQPVEEDPEMKPKFYKIRDEVQAANGVFQPAPSPKGDSIWVTTDTVTTHTVSLDAWVHMKGLGWWDESHVDLIPEALHNWFVQNNHDQNEG